MARKHLIVGGFMLTETEPRIAKVVQGLDEILLVEIMFGLQG